jgi:hypothetical protein
MNSKIQTALETLKSQLSGNALRTLEAKFSKSETIGIRYIEELASQLEDTRFMNEEAIKIAQLCAAFLAEIENEEKPVAAVVEKAPAKEQTYDEYVLFMERQEQPYMSEKQWNEANAPKSGGKIYTFNIDNVMLERENLAQPGTGQMRMSIVAMRGASIKVKEGRWLSIGVKRIPASFLHQHGVLTTPHKAEFFYHVSDPTWSSHDPEGNEYDSEWQYQGEKQQDLLNRIRLEGMEKVDLGDGEIYFI